MVMWLKLLMEFKARPACDSYLRHLTDYELARMKPYKPSMKLLVFETNEYTSPGAWAHTEPEKGVICILPPERRDPYLPIHDHEIMHNLYPEAPEEAIHSMAFNRSYRHQAKSVQLEYR